MMSIRRGSVPSVAETEGATFRWPEFTLDNLIRPGEHRRRNREAEAFTVLRLTAGKDEPP
jgi:hypothetical protein